MNGIQNIPLINGVEHSWANIQVLIEGITVTGITAVEYDTKQDMENIYGAGVNPVARGYGRKTSTASITLLRSEIESIRTSSPTGDLHDIAPFDIIVTFLPVNGQKLTIHNIRNCQFLDDGVEAKEGDTSNAKQLALLPSHIEK